jgi:hypothetical protein
MNDSDMVPPTLLKTRGFLEAYTRNNTARMTHVSLQDEATAVSLQVRHQEACLGIVICAEEGGVAVFVELVDPNPGSKRVPASRGDGWKRTSNIWKFN